MKSITCLLLLLLLPAAAASGQEAPRVAYSDARIDIGLVVADLERAIAFYEGALGLRRAYSFEVASEFARDAGLTAGPPLEVVAFKLSDSPDAPVLKLVRTGEPQPYRPAHITDQSGVRYLTIFVTEMGGLLQRLQSNGVPILGKGPVAMSDGQTLALVQDPDGLFIELIGPMGAAAP